MYMQSVGNVYAMFDNVYAMYEIYMQCLCNAYNNVMQWICYINMACICNSYNTVKAKRMCNVYAIHRQCICNV